jgi:hypothetical protein
MAAMSQQDSVRHGTLCRKSYRVTHGFDEGRCGRGTQPKNKGNNG